MNFCEIPLTMVTWTPIARVSCFALFLWTQTVVLTQYRKSFDFVLNSYFNGISLSIFAFWCAVWIYPFLKPLQLGKTKQLYLDHLAILFSLVFMTVPFILRKCLFFELWKSSSSLGCCPFSLRTRTIGGAIAHSFCLYLHTLFT